MRDLREAARAGAGFDAPERHRSSAVPLAWLYAGLIAYASLYPFTGWHVPREPLFAFLVQGWPRFWTWFDLVSNGIGYLPFAFLVFVAGVRGGRRPSRSAALAFVAGCALSLALETAQAFLPQRVSSSVDLALNAAGSALGAGLGLVLHGRVGVDRWQRIRERWFVRRSAGGVALLLVWPLGLLFPTAVPFGLGHVLARLGEAIAEALRELSLPAWAGDWTGGADAGVVPLQAPPLLSPAAELAIVVLGLLAPCWIAYTVAVAGWRRSALAVGAVVLGAATVTLSTALNFGPQHALAWTTPIAVQGSLVAAGCALALALLPARLATALGLIAITALVMLVAQAPDDPYYAQSVQGWKQGEFIRFYGAAQWVGWAWPYAALAYLLARLTLRGPGER